VTNYPVRTSHRARLTPDALVSVARTAFGTAEVSDGMVAVSFGALTRLTARAAGKELAVEVTMNPNVPVEIAAETVRRYNRFLEEATGFSSKERAKRLRKSATSVPREA
jgi:hypothetical protein